MLTIILVILGIAFALMYMEFLVFVLMLLLGGGAIVGVIGLVIVGAALLFENIKLSADDLGGILLALATTYFVVRQVFDEIRNAPNFQVTQEELACIEEAKKLAEELKTQDVNLTLVFDYRERFGVVPMEVRKIDPGTKKIMSRIYIFIKPISCSEGRLASFKDEGKVFEVTRDVFFRRGYLIKNIREAI